jgi:hypothetical protein
MDGRDWVAGSCLPLRLAEAAALVPAAENSPETRGAGGSAGPWGDLGGRGGWGGRGEPSGGDWVGAGAPEGGGPRRSGSAVALKDSGEQLNATGGNKKDGRGRERFLTSRRTPGTPRWRRRRGGSPSRRWRTSATAQRTSGERVMRTSTPTRAHTPAAPSPAQAPSSPVQAPPLPPGQVTRARARELNYIMLLKNEGPEE